MDMNTAFDTEVKKHCPQAEVVYDLFHVVARYGRDVIDRIRVDQANLLREDKPARKAVKQSRWLLLRNRDNLKDGQAVQLQEAAANQPLATVYVLKDALKDVWYAPAYERVGDAGEPGCDMLARRPRAAATLRSQPAQIRARHPCQCSLHMHTSVLEGVNNRIKVIKRMAYGFRDSGTSS